MTRPALGLLARPGEGELLRPLVRALARSVPVHAVREGRTATAFLATSPAALRRADDATLPAAVWVTDADPVASIGTRSATTTIVTPDQATAESARRAGFPVLAVTAPFSEATAIDPRWPLIRARWRARAALRPDLIVLVHAPDTAIETPLDESVRVVAAIDPERDELLGLASVAIVVDDPVLADAARSAGAPTIETDAADIERAIRLARALCDDPTTASRFAAHGVRAARQAGVERAARTLIDQLDLRSGLVDLEAHTAARLESLGLPATGPFRARLHDAFAPFHAPHSTAEISGALR